MSDAPVPADDSPLQGREHALGDRTAPWWAWAGAALVALAVAASVGVAAGLFRRDDFWLVAAVFTACVLPPAAVLGWFLVVRPRTSAPEPHAEENVERRWTERAATGAFWDVLVVAGLTLTAVSLTGLELSASFVLAVVVLVAMVDFFVRHAVVSRRES
ncbi:hypothetical protein CBR64_10445 [Cellulosimicrobium cellulans]|uniref:Uncharacterized protein n=1 Tax=Cellulosimicrobium cellulans TaxID=1710 RepID=A0A1Y0HX70_CELCE|nr:MULTISPECIES: hypothetical protein [Cellulosimicrobium]ARU51844.1 hypothetical protein CBR64_10445 [Cellulosimicrobium cellulans]